MLNQEKFKIYFEMLCNCEKRLLTGIRTHHNTSNFTQIFQIIFGKRELLFTDVLIQRCKEYFYSVMTKSLLETVLFSSLFAKKGLNT